jgi:ribosomal-protein-alanine N-acetyltransferase
MHELQLRNAAFFAPWMPRRDPGWFTLEKRRLDLTNAAAEHAGGIAYHFGIALNGELVGRINLTDVVRGVFQSAHVGYLVGEEHCGHGYATAAVQAVVDFAFGPAALHRVQAAVMPRNIASLRVMEKARFRQEGLAQRYLCINDAWEDHLLFAMTQEEWQAS